MILHVLTHHDSFLKRFETLYTCFDITRAKFQTEMDQPCSQGLRNDCSHTGHRSIGFMGKMSMSYVQQYVLVYIVYTELGHITVLWPSKETLQICYWLLISEYKLK